MKRQERLNVPEFMLTTRWIIFCFIFFYPAGFFFLILKLINKGRSYTAVNENNEILKNYKEGNRFKRIRNVQIGAGLLFAYIAISEVIDGIKYGYFDFDFIVFALAVSVGCLYLATKRTQKLNKYQPYLNYLAAYGSDPIYDLAKSLGVSHETAVKDLSDMIASKMINAKLSSDDFIVLASDPDKVPSQSRYSKKYIRCTHCGAPNLIGPGIDRKCDYCDSPLE